MPPDATAHALRLALGAPAAWVLAQALAVPLPFLAPTVFVTLAAGLRTAPSPGALAAIVALVWGLPWAIGGADAVLAAHPLLLIAVTGALLFGGLRLQARTPTRAVGALIVLLAAVLPVVGDAALLAADVLRLALGWNATVAVATVALAFLAFPEAATATGRPAGPARADLAPAAATRHALTGMLILLPLVALFLVIDALSALRVLIIAALLTGEVEALDRARRVRVAVASVLLAGAAATGVTFLAAVQPAPWAAALAMALFGLRAAPAIVAGGVSGAVWAAAFTVVWPLAFSGDGEGTLARTLLWAGLSLAAALWVAAASAWLSTGGGRPAPERAAST
jgi:hypothetical protein